MNGEMPARRGILVIRPEPGLTETRHLLEERGWTTWGMESLLVTPRIPARQSDPAGVLITSSQAIPALCGAIDRNVPVYAVGDATAGRVRAQGYGSVFSARGTALELAAFVRDRISPSAGSLLLLSGEKYGLDLCGTLRGYGFTVRRRVAYSVRPRRTLPADVRQALDAGQIGWAMVFSAASACAFRDSLRRAPSPLPLPTCIAISSAATRVLDEAGFISSITARHPDIDSMLAALDIASDTLRPNCF